MKDLCSERQRTPEQHTGPDRYDNDQGDAHPLADGHDEYTARLERRSKHAAWRTEMALRSRASGYAPPRPDGAF